MSGEHKGGLEDVVVSTSDICLIDGNEGRLVYRGYDVDELVEHSSFEEVVYLLWHGGLPTRKELVAHTRALASTANRRLPPKLLAILRALPRKTTPMEVLRTGVSAISAFDPDAADNKSRLGVTTEGAVLGEMSMFDRDVRYATCTAIDAVEAAVLSRAAIGQLIRQHPGVGAKLMVKITQLLAQRLRNTSNRLVRLLQKR